MATQIDKMENKQTKNLSID